ncbi:RNA-directed DNA polymerase [Microbacterium rhizomatis]|nr:RNA-directed DNA polymerase [Microbacterium rhizomatis]
MRIDPVVVKKLKLTEVAQRVTSKPLDRLPMLISERSLEGREGKLVEDVAASYSSGASVMAATFSMPRKGFGPRPITLLAARDRIAYDALVDQLRPALPPESRTPENWAAFRAFGRPGAPGTTKYIVTLDIASMYEYVDHAILRRELLVQTMDVPHVEATVELLGEAFGSARGLPQMVSSSDVLADAYLSILERALLRHGYEVLRYADDFKVLASDWATANQIIERAAEVARGIGLILSAEKTAIHKVTKFEDDDAVLQKMVDKYFTAAQSDLTTFDELMDWYGEPVTTEEVPDDQTAMNEAFRRVLKDWTKNRSRSELPSQLVAKALRSLRNAPDRVSDKTLTQLVFIDPLKLSSVILYLRARPSEQEKNRRSISRLVAMERQSPWAKLWLLTYSSELTIDESVKHARQLSRWVERQLEDEHEVVRAEAAWTLAKWGELTERRLARLFGAATSITRTGLAAAWGRTGAALDHDLSKVIAGSSPVYRQAFAWGGEQRAVAAEQAS